MFGSDSTGPGRCYFSPLSCKGLPSVDINQRKSLIRVVLEGNAASEGNTVKWPLRNGVICVMTDVYRTSGRLGSVCL